MSEKIWPWKGEKHCGKERKSLTGILTFSHNILKKHYWKFLFYQISFFVDIFKKPSYYKAFCHNIFKQEMSLKQVLVKHQIPRRLGFF